MSVELKQKVIELLKNEPKGAAALYVSKKLGVTLMEVRRILEELVKEGKAEKRGSSYRLR